MRKGILLAAAGMLVMTASAGAGANYGEPASTYYVSAPVVGVVPITTQRSIRNPVRQCTTAQRYADDRYDNDPYDRHHHQHGSYFFPGLIGGVVGGLIGNQFGGGSGKKALTIAGALAGSSIARDAARQRDRQRYSRPEVCRTTYQTEVVSDVTAYDVTYEYAGQLFTKRMNAYPGDTVQVRIALEPALADR